MPFYFTILTVEGIDQSFSFIIINFPFLDFREIDGINGLHWINFHINSYYLFGQLIGISEIKVYQGIDNIFFVRDCIFILLIFPSLTKFEYKRFLASKQKLNTIIEVPSIQMLSKRLK